MTSFVGGFVRIALVGAGTFAEVNIVEGDTISRLAERACVKFPHWGVNAGQISLHLVAAGGDDEPAEEAIGAVLSSGRLGVGWSLNRAEIFSGAWLVARKIVDSGASPWLARVSPRTPHSPPHLSSPPRALCSHPQSPSASATPAAGGGGGAADLAASIAALAEELKEARVRLAHSPANP